MLPPREVRHRRRAPGGDQDVAGAPAARALGAGHLHGVRVAQGRPSLYQFHAGRTQQVVVRAAQPLDLVGPVLLQALPVQAGRRQVPAEARGVAEVLGELRRMAVKLLGDAADVDAGAAQRGGLRQHHARPALGRHAGGPDTAAAPADDEQIAIETAQRRSLLRAAPARQARL